MEFVYTIESYDYFTSINDLTRNNKIKKLVDHMNFKILRTIQNKNVIKHAEPLKETKFLKKINEIWTFVDNIMTIDEFYELNIDINLVNEANDFLMYELK
jgi:hypothetical protein